MMDVAGIAGAFLLGFSLAAGAALVYVVRWMREQGVAAEQQSIELLQTVRRNSEVLNGVSASQKAVGGAINGLSAVIRQMTPSESRLTTFERRLNHLEETLLVERP